MADVPIGDVQKLPHEERIADFNCVTTWCVRGVRWGGVPFRTFYEDIVLTRCQPSLDVRWLRIVGLDGGSAIVAVEDALRDEVLLADSLDGEPLTLVHGAPVPFVSPAQYAYKSVKHLVSIELSVERPRWVPTNIPAPVSRRGTAPSPPGVARTRAVPARRADDCIPGGEVGWSRTSDCAGPSQAPSAPRARSN